MTSYMKDQSYITKHNTAFLPPEVRVPDTSNTDMITATHTNKKDTMLVLVVVKNLV